MSTTTFDVGCASSATVYVALPLSSTGDADSAESVIPAVSASATSTVSMSDTPW